MSAAAPPPLVLASGSPRRRELLAALGLDFTVVTSEAEDPLPPRLSAEPDAAAALVVRYAEAKARDVAGRVAPGAVVLGADTIVTLHDGTILGKPRDRADAARMMRALGGVDHLVTTGVCVIATRPPGRTLAGADTSVVRLPVLSGEDLSAYLEGGTWRGKAGAYGIQDPGTRVEWCRGAVTTVVGLCVARAARLLGELGVPIDPARADSVEAAYDKP